MGDNDLRVLAIACRNGDPRGFETLVNTESRALIVLAYRYTGDWEVARDLTQDTWIRVHERIHRWDPAKSFRAWLIAVHRNGCLDHLRRVVVGPFDADETTLSASPRDRSPGAACALAP